jgi:hypothetical protein
MGVMTPSPLSLDTLVGLARRSRSRVSVPARLVMPDGMTAPLGCDAVAIPAVYGRRVLDRLPRVGCVFADGSSWWWIVPSDSDVALQWPEPARYTAGALVRDARRPPLLIHRPESSVPYTPPIPLYLALCRLTGATPAWSSALPA